MTGTNTLQLNALTMAKIIERWLKTEMPHQKLKVQSVTTKADGYFYVNVVEQEPDLGTKP